MSAPRTITDFSHLTDSDLDTLTSSIIKACKNNTKFNFANKELENVEKDYEVYHNDLNDIPLGGTLAVTRKKTSRPKLLKSLKILAKTVNLQGMDDLEALQSSGIPMAAEPSHHKMIMPINFRIIIEGIIGCIKLMVDKAPFTDYGTVFAYTLASNPSDDPNTWTQVSVTGHSVTLTDLVSMSRYKFASAYRSGNNAKLVWSVIIPHSVL